MKITFLALGIVSLLLLGCTSHPVEVVSPDGHIRLVFALESNDRMTYRVEVNDTAFILSSSLGFKAEAGINLSDNFQVTGTDFATHDQTWTQPWGENKTIRNHYNEKIGRAHV